MPDMTPSDPTSPEPAAVSLPEVRFLKILVTVLTAVMIFGLVAVIGLLVTRLGGVGAPGTALPALPSRIALPDGMKAEAVTVAKEFTIVVTDRDSVLLFRPDGTLVRAVPIGE